MPAPIPTPYPNLGSLSGKPKVDFNPIKVVKPGKPESLSPKEVGNLAGAGPIDAQISKIRIEVSKSSNSKVFSHVTSTIDPVQQKIVLARDKAKAKYSELVHEAKHTLNELWDEVKELADDAT